MPPYPPVQRRAFTDAIAWTAAAPVLALWPFLSSMPLFSLLSHPAVDIASGIDIAFLATGFWAFCALWLADRYFRYDPFQPRAARASNRFALWLSLYAGLWSAAYAAASLTR